MAFSGYLIKIGGAEFPHMYIKYESYKATPNQRLDLDSYRDADGLLHREVLEHTATKIEFETRELWLEQKDEVMGIIKGAMENDAERKVDIEYWDDENSTYATATVYIPDIQFPIKYITKDNIRYQSVRLAFIEY